MKHYPAVGIEGNGIGFTVHVSKDLEGPIFIALEGMVTQLDASP